MSLCLSFFVVQARLSFSADVTSQHIIDAQVFEEHTQMLILQRDYHEVKTQQSLSHEKQRNAVEFIRRIQAIYNDDAEISYGFTPSHLGEVPYTLFKPKVASGDHKVPLVVHVHGGPGVFFGAKTWHAEVAFLVKHGIAVVCPNYRGSDWKQYPMQDEDQAFKAVFTERRKEKLNQDRLDYLADPTMKMVKGPESIATQDVYQTACHLQSQDFIDDSCLVLRGASFGSTLNALLLSEIKAGRYENLKVKGVHLSAGNYPSAVSLSRDVPLLLTHGMQDDRVAFSHAKDYPRKLYISEHDKFRYFFAPKGDHHMIAKDVTLKQQATQNYQDLKKYAQLSMGFVLFLAGRLSPELALMGDGNYMPSEADRNVKEHFSWIQAMTDNVLSIPKITVSEEDERNPRCPSLSHLKLILGERYTGHIEDDVTTFFTCFFRPIVWEQSSSDGDAWPKLSKADCRACLRSIAYPKVVQALRHEADVIQHHPDYQVYYHTGNHDALFLMTMISLFKSFMKQETPISSLSEMRYLDMMVENSGDIHQFLSMMRQRAKACGEEQLNYTPGFFDRTLAVNFSLFGNRHNTASASFWWFLKNQEHQVSRAPVEKEIKDFLAMLGLDPDKCKRYLRLLELLKLKQHTRPGRQAVLQQIFVPTDKAEKNVYLCQFWGNEFLVQGGFDLSQPAHIDNMVMNPVTFEKTLCEHKSCFTNPGKLPDYGDKSKGFLYTDVISARMLWHPDLEVKVASYVRDDDAFRDLVRELTALIREDLSDLLSQQMSALESVRPELTALRKCILGEEALVRGEVRDEPSSPTVFTDEMIQSLSKTLTESEISALRQDLERESVSDTTKGTLICFSMRLKKEETKAMSDQEWLDVCRCVLSKRDDGQDQSQIQEASCVDGGQAALLEKMSEQLDEGLFSTYDPTVFTYSLDRLSPKEKRRIHAALRQKRLHPKDYYLHTFTSYTYGYTYYDLLNKAVDQTYDDLLAKAHHPDTKQYLEERKERLKQYIQEFSYAGSEALRDIPGFSYHEFRTLMRALTIRYEPDHDQVVEFTSDGTRDFSCDSDCRSHFFHDVRFGIDLVLRKAYAYKERCYKEASEYK